MKIIKKNIFFLDSFRLRKKNFNWEKNYLNPIGKAAPEDTKKIPGSND